MRADVRVLRGGDAVSFVDVCNVAVGVGLGMLCALFPPAIIVVAPYFFIRWRMLS
jgi:hypothetical protein